MSTSVLADKQTAEHRDGFYLKADLGASKMKNVRIHYIYPEEHINLTDNKSKSKVSPTVNVAAGFFFNDYIKHDLSFGYQKVKFRQSTVDCIWYDIKTGNILDEHGKFTVNRKASIYSLMFNSYVDLPINENLNFFAGVGLGVTRISEKGNLIVTANKVNVLGDKVKSKEKQNFSHSSTTGLSYKLIEGLNLQLSYKWSDYGKTKFNDKDITKNLYRGHSILTVIRYHI